MNTLPLDLVTWFLANFCGLELRGRISLACKDLRAATQTAAGLAEAMLDLHFLRLAVIDSRVPADDEIRYLAHTRRPGHLSEVGEAPSFADRLREWIRWRLDWGQGLPDPSGREVSVSTFSVTHDCLLVARVNRDTTGWYSLSVTKSEDGDTVESRLALADIAPDQLLSRLFVVTSHADAVFLVLVVTQNFDTITHCFRYDFNTVPSPRIVAVATRRHSVFGVEDLVVAPNVPGDSWRYTTGLLAYEITRETASPRYYDGPAAEPRFYGFRYILRWPRSSVTSQCFAYLPCARHSVLPDVTSQRLVVQGNGITLLLLRQEFLGDEPEYCQVFVPVNPSDGLPMTHLAWRGNDADCHFLYAWWADDLANLLAHPTTERHWYIVVNNFKRKQWEVYRNDNLLMYRVASPALATHVHPRDFISP